MSTEDRNSRDFNEARIKQEASDWVAKHDCGLSAEEQDAFFEWLAENPAHSEAYSRRQIVWKEMNVLADWPRTQRRAESGLASCFSCEI